MLLYHFTATQYLDRIKAEGITKGELPVSQTEVRNALAHHRPHAKSRRWRCRASLDG
jgi:hypothetical protein